jgi:hypothetical protein
VTHGELSGFGIRTTTDNATVPLMRFLLSIRALAAALAAALVASTACSSTRMDIEALAGRYELRSVNARTVPVDALGGALGGELVLSDHGRVRRIVQYATSGVPGPITMRANGSYSVRGKEITLDLVEEPRGALLARSRQLRGEVVQGRIILRYPGRAGADTEEVYVRVQ